MIQSIALLLSVARDYPLDVLLLLIIAWQQWRNHRLKHAALSWYHAYDAESNEVERLETAAKRKRTKATS